MSFMEIAQVDQIPPGSMKSFNIKGTSVFIVNIGGSFYAMGNKCTHMGGRSLERNARREDSNLPKAWISI